MDTQFKINLETEGFKLNISKKKLTQNFPLLNNICFIIVIIIIIFIRRKGVKICTRVNMGYTPKVTMGDA